MKVLPSNFHIYDYATQVIGFGHDSINDDYRLFISTPISHRSCDEIFRGRRFELYRAKTKTWTTLGTGFSDYFGFEYGCAFVRNHNALHWIIAPRRGGFVYHVERFVLAFDLATEELAKFSMPKFQEETYCEYKPVEFGGYLCVFSGYEDACRLDMWAMMEYGESTTWAKLFSVVPSSNYSALKPLTYNYKTSDEVLLIVDRERFILYDLKTNTEKEVNISGLPNGPIRYFDSELCVSSLVRLDDAMISC
ncbi:F-box associated interaction domain containing protein [Trema orientale]|uniref:F-box associated interaction domain containing protein n=1 Tax=Trema orientale TaxID=63057 RepID=A0A2P5FNX8_TREOI|nr:F-box associated interaction domain containing protein [Trema orientale]